VDEAHCPPCRAEEKIHNPRVGWGIRVTIWRGAKGNFQKYTEEAASRMILDLVSWGSPWNP
jgi:hypothetical protein